MVNTSDLLQHHTNISYMTKVKAKLTDEKSVSVEHRIVSEAFQRKVSLLTVMVSNDNYLS